MCKRKMLFFVVFIFSMTTLAGCIGNTNTVETCVLSNVEYNDKAELESAKQPERFAAGSAIYASVRFIESPLGMEYTGKWFINDNEIKTETKAMVTNRCGIIIFPLEADRVTAGKIRFEIRYGDDVLFSKELYVQ